VARSDNSMAEREGREDLFSANGVEVFTMDKTPQWEIDDVYTTNPRDAGMRLILDGGVNTTSTYHVRIRSSSDDLSDINGGLTSGAYQLQIRLREVDEIGGSTIRFGTIAYANNGIEALGLPTHSPLAGEIGEPNEDPTLPNPLNPEIRPNDTFATAVDIGNLLHTDRGAFSIAGSFLSAIDVDWYSFDVIDEVGGHASTYPVTFDIDYSDGLSRAPAGISVFDSNGTLILLSLASNIGDDRPEPTLADNLEDLTRGTVGASDALIGPVELPVGQTYFVAVYGQGMGPTQLNSNPYARIEPIESVNRLVEDRGQPYEQITFQPPLLGSATVDDPTDEFQELFDVISPVQFHLGDVPLYVSQDWDVGIPGDAPWDLTRLITIDPFTGQPETTVNAFGSGAVRSFTYDVSDIALNTDGNFYSFSLDLEDPDGLSDAESGNYLRISPADGSAVNLGDDGILTYEGDFTNAPLPPTPIRANLINNQRVGYGVQFHAIDFLDHPFSGVKNGYFGIAIGNRGDGEINPLQQNGVNAKTNLLYLFDQTTGSVFHNPGGVTLQSGDRLPLRGDAATDAIEVGEVLTSARLTSIETTDTSFIPPLVPVLVPEPGVPSNFLLQDRGLTTFEIFDGIGTTVFELDFGPEVRQEVNTFTNGNIDFRFVVEDGNFFELDPNANVDGDEVIYQLDTGPVLEILRSDIEDGQIITVSAGSFTGIFEFDLDGTVNNSAAEAVDIAGFVDPTAIAGILATVINAHEVSGRGGVLATAVGPRITFEAERSVTVAPAPSTPGALPTQLRIIGAADINPILQAVPGDNIAHLDNITMRIANFNNPLVFEFVKDGMPPSGTADVEIAITSTDDADTVARKIDNAINGFARAISTQLVGDRVVVTAQGIVISTSSPVVDITNVLETHLVAIEETMMNHDLGVTVAATVNATSGFLASAEGTRINFSPAGIPVQVADFAGVPNWTDIGSATGVVPGNVPVFVNAADDEAATIQAIAAAINNTLSPSITAIAGLSSLRLNSGQLIADAPLVARGEGPGGIIQGVTQTASGGIYAVSDNGGLYRIQFPIPVSNDPLDYPSFNDPIPFETGSVTYIQSSEADLLGIQFVGLTEGPRSTEGRYANMLFGIDAGGRLYAFNTAGVLQPVFANGATSIDTGLTDVNGLEFGNLEGNLWGQTGARGPATDKPTNFGHGTDPTFNGTRSDFIGVADLSWNFGGYTQTGGAYGTMVSNPFSLAGYSASDIPALFFNFYSEKGAGDVAKVWITENNGDDVGGTNDGNWIPLIADVTDQSGGWSQIALNMGGFAGLEELRLRLDFSSNGELNIGDPFSIGSEIRAPRGVYLQDGEIFTIDDQDFELDSGITLVMPSGDSIPAGEQFTIDDGTNQVTFQFDDDFTFPSNIQVNVDGSQFFDGQSFIIDDGQGTADSVQTFELDSGFILEAPADGSLLLDGETFEIRENGVPTVFEFDNNDDPNGNLPINIRDNYGLIIPANGTIGAGAVQDTERFFIELDGNGPVWFEFDSNGSTNPTTDQT
ncbi:MAG: hypothetical protein ACI9HK_004969, partial [Pirellulaceae bacterium]